MTNKLAFEALDHTLRDLIGTANQWEVCACFYVVTLDRSCQLFRVVLEATLLTHALKAISVGPHSS